VITPQPGGTLYGQVAAQLRKDILSGRIRPGQRLPSERTLQQEFDVGRETARRAVAMLRSEGLVAVDRGHGVVVREQPELEELIPPAGSQVTARMPSPEERAEHGLGEGVPVFWVVQPDGSSGVYPADQWRIRMP
jgi:DNA-binding FadR family transcriptional regulator